MKAMSAASNPVKHGLFSSDQTVLQGLCLDVRFFLFRRLLQTLFIWRMQIAQPDEIELGIDTMVMDNDNAE